MMECVRILGLFSLIIIVKRKSLTVKTVFIIILKKCVYIISNIHTWLYIIIYYLLFSVTTMNGVCL